MNTAKYKFYTGALGISLSHSPYFSLRIWKPVALFCETSEQRSGYMKQIHTHKRQIVINLHSLFALIFNVHYEFSKINYQQ